MSALARLALLVIALSGCSDSLARPSELEGLRVLAIGAEPTGAPPGETIAVEALWWADGERAAELRWSICPALPDGSIDRCDGEERTLESGAGLDAIDLVAPTEIGTHLLRLELCAEPFGSDGSCTGDHVTAARRLAVAEDEPSNENPVLESLSLAAPDADGDRELVATVAEGSSEPLADGEPEDSEELLVSWFSTTGSLADDRSFGPERFATRWTPDPDAPEATFFAVLRDGRGGVAWATAQSP